MILYNRKKVKYRKDGYCWKKRKDGKTTREDHMKLKVQGVEVKHRRGSLVSQTSFPGCLGWHLMPVTSCQKGFLFAKTLLFFVSLSFFLPLYPVVSISVFCETGFN